MISKKATPEELLERQPPRSIEAERGVIASILITSNVLDDLALKLRPEDFYDAANRRLYRELLDMHTADRRIDTTLLQNRLRKSNTMASKDGESDFEVIGGTAYLADVAVSCPTAAHVMHYAEIVHDNAILRDLIEASTDILRDALDRTTEPRDAINRAEERLLSVRDNRAIGANRVADIGDVLADAMIELDKRQAGAVKHGTETGFFEIDKLLSLVDGELVVLAARPSMGKTALAMNIASNVAAESQVLFVSLEMESMALCERLLGATARVCTHDLAAGRLPDGFRKKVVEASSGIAQLKLTVDDSPQRTVTEIAAVARRLKRKKGLALVIVDYLQLIEPDDHRTPREQQVARISKRLKGLARELSVPVICLAQLNRGSEATASKKPGLSNLRESGAIEQDADVVMFVHREEFYTPTKDNRGLADIIVAKHRNGPTGEAKLAWFEKFTRFDNLATPYTEMKIY